MPRITNRTRVREYLERQEWVRVGTREWEQLRADLPDMLEASLREGIRDAGLTVDQPWAGVVTKTLDELHESLRAMSEAYEGGEAQAVCREQVIAAKDRARFAAKNPKVDPEKREIKAEMVEWMLVWLGDPAIFPVWAEARRKQMGIAGV